MTAPGTAATLPLFQRDIALSPPTDKPLARCQDTAATERMRPTSLVPVFASALDLSGVGPRIEILLKKAVNLPPGVTTPRVVDLVSCAPSMERFSPTNH